MENNVVGALLCEETNANVEFKVKDVTKSGFVIAEGILQEGNSVNRNKRIYPTEELRACVNSPRQKELVSTGNFKGEAGHPSNASLQRQTKIDPTLEQVWYTKLWMDGDYVMAHFRGTNNDLGRSFNDDLKDGQKPSFSLRAVGSLVNEGGKLIVQRMQMITYDRVYYPSHSKAYTTRLVTTESAGFGGYESVKYYKANPGSYFYYKNKELNAISESGNVIDTTDSIMIPIKQEAINNFLISESGNVRSVMNNFDVLYETMELDPTGRQVKMRTMDGNTVYLNLESAVRDEIIDGVMKFF